MANKRETADHHTSSPAASGSSTPSSPLAPKERAWRETRPSGAANALQQLVHTAQEFEQAVWNGHVSSPVAPPSGHEA